MTREEEIRKQASKYGEPEYLLQAPNILGMQGFIQGATWADKHPYLSEEEQVGLGGLGIMWQKKHLIDTACKCFCDDLCEKSLCGMCFHKYDGKHQIKNSFQYKECNELQLLRKTMES